MVSQHAFMTVCHVMTVGCFAQYFYIPGGLFFTLTDVNNMPLFKNVSITVNIISIHKCTVYI